MSEPGFGEYEFGEYEALRLKYEAEVESKQNCAKRVAGCYTYGIYILHSLTTLAPRMHMKLQ